MPNIINTVPFLAVTNMESSLAFYVDGLGFEITRKWIPRDHIEWCALKREGANLMLQEFSETAGSNSLSKAALGHGVSIFFICNDSLVIYQELIAKGIKVSEPFVSNSMWLISLRDPDNYSIEFESYTDVPEGTRFFGWKQPS